MSIDLTTLSAREVLSAVYIGYYNRAADPAGMQFWEQVIADTSLDLVAVATDFSGQSETQAVHPFFADPATSTPSTFITSLYQNLFNRDPDDAGLEFWSEQLQNAIDGVEGSFSVGEIIVKIIEGAVDVDGGTQDRTTILNKIEVAQDWTDAAEAAGGEFDADAMASAKAIIADVTSDAATVAAAKETTDAFFEPAPVPGDTFLLTSSTDVMTGTANADEFNAYIQQNPAAGGVSNSLSSADRLDGGAGDDRLYAELAPEFLGSSGGGGSQNATDIQPRLTSIEEIDLEARDRGNDNDNNITVDAKNITDHVEIGSYFSDGDLKIENLTTLTAGGTARNTSDITVTMDHTDNRNSDGDASDLEVLFDNDYLLSGQESEGQVFYHLLDEDAELAGLTDRLDNIDVDGIRFNITNADGSVTDVTIEDPAAQTAGTHQGFVNALQDALQALIADGTLPAGTTLTLDPTNIDRTFLDDGTESADIPAITLITGDGSAVEATGFSRVEEAIGEYDVYGRFGEVNEVADQPISIDIDLHKVGRGGNGGDLIIGGKARDVSEGIAGGIEVFNIDVLGAGSEDPNGAANKPSSLGEVTSTLGALTTVNIATAAEFVSGATHASLEIREGFNGTGSETESGDLKLVNADAFLGNLMLGTTQDIVNLDTLTAQGGGDVVFNGLLNGTEINQAYSYTTGSGDDAVDLELDGDALDYADSSVNVFTAGGDDSITVTFQPDTENTNNHQLNQAILDNVSIDAGAGADTITVDGVGGANILAGDGNDTVYTDGAGTAAVWALNFDNIRADAQTGGLGGSAADDLPGVPTSLAYIGGAEITVTLSGAGIGDALGLAGGGVMALGAAGAVANDDGYESTVTIDNLINGNDHYGDQRDINAAIMTAINDDPVLSKLLSVSMGANNTLVVTSKTSGVFAATDLRIDIAQKAYTSASFADSVVDEAQTLFSNSSIVVGDLFAGTAAGDLYDSAVYGADLSAATGDSNAWYDGLSNDATNQADDNLHTAGTADLTENDNVINGGAGDDVIVLSTDAVGVLPLAFTPAGARSSLISGASNETIVLTGSNFGDDTVMNFQDGDYTAAAAEIETTNFDFAGLTVTGGDLGTVDVTVNGATVTVDLDSGAGDLTAADIAVLVQAEVGGTVAGDTVIDIPTVAGTDQYVFDADGAGVGAPSPAVAGTPGTPIPAVAFENGGLDFLDFTAYLTSMQSSSGSSTSEVTTPVTLSTDTDAAANEVIVASYDEDSDGTDGNTFATLSAADIAALYNDDTNIDNLTGTAFEQVEAVSVVDGSGKAVLMVENANNDGEYKVFELTWDAAPASGDDDMSVSLLGSLDFGDTLELEEINLVGTSDYNTLIADGFV